MTREVDFGDYATRYAAQYSGESWFEQVMVAARRAQVLASLERHPHERVLEVGCGLEPLFQHCEGWSQFTVVEPVERFATAARAAAQDDVRVRVVEGTLEDRVADVRIREYDFVVVSSLLHEVPDPDRFLRSVREVCGPTTVVHVNVPNVRSFHRLLALESGLIDDVFEQSEMERRFQRTTRYDRQTFCAVLERHGFEVLRFETYFVKPFTHGQMEALFDRAGLDRRVLQGLSRMIRHVPELGAEMLAEVRRV